jgi:3-phenylpropionate/cinnamic acid dioxygenase small subunit
MTGASRPQAAAPAPALLQVDRDLQFELEQMLFVEADLLDEWRFEEWIALMAADIRYWMPTRSNRLLRERAKEVAGDDEAAYFDETLEHLEQRLYRLRTGMAWSEEPPTRTRHLVTNARIRPTAEPAEYRVQASFLCYANRQERDVTIFAGRRTDVWRRAPERAYGWELSFRKILLDQATLLAKGISIFL